MFETTKFWETKAIQQADLSAGKHNPWGCASRRVWKGQGAKSHTSDNWNMWEMMEKLLFSAAGDVIWHVCVPTHVYVCTWMRLFAELCGRRVRDIGGEHVCTNTSLHAETQHMATALGCTSSSTATLIQGNHGSLALGTFQSHWKHHRQFWAPPVHDRHW